MSAVKLLNVGALACLLNISSADAVPVFVPQPRNVAAPKLHEAKTLSMTDLGMWDDVFAPHNQDYLVLRRGDELFSLSMEANAKPKKIAKVTAADNTHVVTGAAVEKKLWLFLNSHKTGPCAVDALSGTVVTFEIPGLKVPGSQAAGIQSHRIIPHLQTALLMISGGDKSTWPRDGNRPVYFWMDLKSGKVVRLPIGWDLDYLSADEGIAAFGPKRAIDNKTGATLETAPNRLKEHFSAFDWTCTQRVKPLFQRREGKGDAHYLTGLSVDGRVLPLDLGIEEERYVSLAKADDTCVAFRLRRSGASIYEASPLMIAPFKDPKKVETLANDVTDFSMLGYGNSLYVTVAKPIKRNFDENRYHAETFFYHRGERATWNVLEGVERLPMLPEVIAKLEYVEDKCRARLIEGFGTTKHEPAVLCLFEHFRADRRAFATPEMGPVIKSEVWRRAIIVGRDGKRTLAPLFQERNLPDHIWLHQSGKVFTGTNAWEGADNERRSRIQLAETTVQKP